MLDAGSFPSEPLRTVDLLHEATVRPDSQHMPDFPPEATDRFSPRIKFGHAGEARIVSVGCH